MKHVWFIISLLSVCILRGYAQIPAGYYDGAEGLSGDALKAALNDIISGHTVYPYTSSGTDVWDILKATDRDPVNPANVILLYTGWSVDAAQEYNNGNGWTREHCWPKSHGFPTESQPAYTDCHHLRPEDVSVNSARNSRWYGECNEPYIDGSTPTGSWTSSTEWVWKPRDAVKGDCARMIFYMATRYEGEYNSTAGVTEVDLEIMDFIPTNNNDPNPIMAVLSDLLAWHEQDPVDDFERNRNEVVYSYQGNRNPYIDHPEYACLVFGTNCPGSVANPYPFSAIGTSNDQIDLNWGLNANSNHVVLAWNTTNTFGIPSGTYSPNDPITGGGTVLFDGNGTTFNHTGLLPQTYNYRIWSYNETNVYSSGANASAGPIIGEPTYDPSNFMVSGTTFSSINLSWTDVSTGIIPTGYLIKASTGAIIDPVDGTPESDGTFIKNVVQGIQSVSFVNLSPNTLYSFKIYPYTNSGSNIDFKISSPASTSGITDELPIACAVDLLISEYGEGSSWNKYIEVYNGMGSSVNLSNYRLVKWTNGSTTAVLISAPVTTLNDNDVFIVCYPSADATILELADMTSGNASFNGNDAVGLQKTTNGGSSWTTIDIIGVVGQDPGLGWPVAGTSTATMNHMLVRKSTVVSGNIDWTASAGTNADNSEWIVLAVDDYSELGDHFIDCESINRYTWQGDDTNAPNDWQTSENWDKGSVPDAGNTVVIPVVTHFPIIDDGLSTAVCKDLTINSGANVTIATNGQMTVSGDLINYAGTGGLLIKSDQTGDGSLICHNSPSACIERFLPSVIARWNFVSSPITSAPLSVFPSLSNLYEYDESTDDFWTGGGYDAGSVMGWTVPIGNLSVGKGYIYYYNQTVLNFEGNLNTNASGCAFSVPYTYHGTIAPNGTDYDNYDGFALVGNPYPCALDWEAVDVSNNLTSTVWYYDNVLDNYATYTKGGISTNGGSRYIPSMKGFVVKSNSGGGSLWIPNTAKIHDNTESFKTNVKEFFPMKLKVTGNNYSDETVIISSKDASTGMNVGLVVYKMLSFNDSVPQLFSIDPETNGMLAVNFVGIGPTGKIIPLSVIAMPGDFEIAMVEESFENIDYIYLQDRLSQGFFNLRSPETYPFTHTGGRVNGRFFVHLGLNQAPIVLQHIEDQTAYINRLFEFTIGAGVFADYDIEDTFTICVNPLPEWLSFDPSTRSFRGIPPVNSETQLKIDVTATDTYGAQTTTDFNLYVNDNSGIADIETIKLFPNPSEGIFYLESPENMVITITDLSGRAVFSKTLHASKTMIDISHCPAGIYIVYLKSERNNYQIRMVRN
jgi:endonuclease I